MRERGNNTDQSRNNNNHHDDHQEHGVASQIGDAAHAVAQGLGPVARSAHFLNQHLPRPLHIISEAVEVVAEVAHDIAHNPGEVVENLACGSASGLVRIGGTALLTARVVAPAAVINSIAETPWVGIPVTIGIGVAIQSSVDRTVAPWAQATNQACHNAFASARGTQTPSQTQTPTASAQRQCQTTLTRDRILNNALNSFAPPNVNIYRPRPSAPNMIPRPYSWQSPFYNPYGMNNSYSYLNMYTNTYNSNFNRVSSLDVHNAVRRALSQEMSKLSPSLFSAYSKACSELGMGYSLSLGEFRSVASMTNLISSYNSFNPGSKLRDVVNFCREIGGVGNDVSTINDLIDSEAHALANEYFVCLPTDVKSPFPKPFLSQITRELKVGYFTHKSFPFFSLHFNQMGFLYPVIHPAYQNTLIGEIIGLLDYWMKGFLNGGVFDAEFLKIWHETGNCDEAFLRSKLIDLKKYCKEQAKGVNYTSLRELMSRYGLNDKSATQSAYQQPFMTSFRIIASQEKVQRNGNILIPHPTFRVEYSIDLMPDYKHYIEEYCKEHGHYPEEYQQIRHCYELFAEEIKEKLPKLPFCQDFFQLLGAINSFCYFYSTLDKMGKEPVFDEIPSTHAYPFPKSLPPIPVRYYRTLPLDMNFAEVINQIIASQPQGTLDTSLKALFSMQRIRKLPFYLDEQITQAVLAIMRNKLASQFPGGIIEELNEEDVEKIAGTASHFLLQQLHQVHGGLHQALKRMSTHLKEDDKKALSTLPLPEKIERTKDALKKHLETLILRWKESPELAITELFNEIPKDLHEEVRKKFKGMEEEIKKHLDEVKDKQISTIIEKEIVKMEAAINQQVAEQLKEANIELSKLTELKANRQRELVQINEIKNNRQNELAKGPGIKSTLQKRVTELTALVNSKRQHQTAQVNSIPAHLRAANQANINKFLAETNQQINDLTKAIMETNSNINEVDKSMKKISENIGEIDKAIKELNENIKEIDEAMADINKGIKNAPALVAADIARKKIEIDQSVREHFQSEQKVEEFQKNQEKVIAHASKKEAVRILKVIYEQQVERLDTFSVHIDYFTNTLLKAEAVSTRPICKKYTHAVIGFTGQDLAEKTGDNFRIIGGCGMSLPNVESKPIVNGEDFALSVANACLDNEEEINTFQYQGQIYTVIRVAVRDCDTQLDYQLAEETSAQDIAQEILSSISETDSIDASVSAEVVKTVMDASGATFMHYAATLLSEPYFEKLLSLSPDETNHQDSLGHLPIHAASIAGNSEVVEKLIELNPQQLEACTKSGATPLILAAQYGKKAVVERLLSLGANPNYGLPNGLYPLYISIQNNYPDIALLMLEKVSTLEISKTIDNHMTPLHLAIENKLSAVALKLIAKGAKLDVKRKTDGFTPLHCAAQQGELELIKLMAQQGINLYLPLESKKTILHIAAEAGDVELIRYLIEQRLSVDEKTIDGETPLMLAIKAGHVEAAQLLAQHAAINTINEQGQTASMLAIQYGMPTVSDILIARNENPQLRDKQGYSYVYYLVRNGEYHRFKLLTKQHQIDANQKYDGNNLLALAAQFGHFFLAYDLIDKQVPFKSKQKDLKLIHHAVIADEIGFLREWLDEHQLDEGNVTSSGIYSGKSLAWFAAQHGSNRCLALLLKQLGSKEVKNQDLLSAAINSRNSSTVNMVLQRCEDLNQPLDTKQNTALHLAVSQGSLQLVELLLSRGSDVFLRNTNKQTAFHIAVNQEDDYLLKGLFKLTRPSEWPHDLWLIDKPSRAVTKVLEKYRKRLPVPSQSKDMLATVTADLAYEVATLQPFVEPKRIEILKELFEEEAFDEAADLLEENTDLLNAFKSSSGGTLLQAIFANIYDYTSVIKELEDKADDMPAFSQPDRMLALLKKEGIKPTDFIGKENVLLAIIMAKTEEDACYRLELFSKWFPESLPLLAQDHYTAKIRFAELALKLNKPKLFEKLDELCLGHQTGENSSFCGLHEAVLADNYTLVKSLLTRYSANLLNNKKQTPLMLAAAKGNIRIMELLLSQGAEADRQDIQGQNALAYALSTKSEQTALFILPLLRHKNQADRRGITPLALAAAKGMLSIVRYLCEDANYTQSFDELGHSPLHQAALAGDVKTITYLATHGFDVNQVEMPSSPSKLKRCQKRTPLHLAALSGHVDAVAALLELGSDPDIADALGNTVCEYAVLSKDTEMLRAIKQLPSWHSQEHDRTLLQAAARSNNKEAASELILGGINPNGVDAGGRTALHLAAITNSGDVAKLLIQAGQAVINLPDNQGNTALHHAASFGHVRIIDLLLAQEPTAVNKANQENSTPLFIACSQGHSGAVAALLKAGADFTIPNPQGLTPAQIALLKGHLAIAHQLVAAGDKSLEITNIAMLSQTVKEKIKEKHTQFVLEERLLMAKESKVADRLIRHGIYRPVFNHSRSKETLSETESNIPSKN
ncbi:Ankyrin repeat protein [Legionella nautarum]|uniref:Ankyrin repeat protein n=1 Tax=Legionella nautarum TaxID=45070 RepID=A0A0W0WJ37_9GAMM|nr:ankyrin repeat domain-containing protein [Legionella nautarum]KTD32259.1 Ankyrin repeat protein [Legionella nautarum]